jgi:hypothetical protein
MGIEQAPPPESSPEATATARNRFIPSQYPLYLVTIDAIIEKPADEDVEPSVYNSD